MNTTIAEVGGQRSDGSQNGDRLKTVSVTDLPQVSKPSAAQEIAALHERIVTAARRSLDDAIRIGELLTQEKIRLPHVQFGDWLKANVPFSERTARFYMQVFRNRDRLKTATVADLGLGYALRQLSTPLKTATVADLASHVEQVATGSPNGSSATAPQPPLVSPYLNRRLALPTESRKAQAAQAVARAIAACKFAGDVIGAPDSAVMGKMPQVLSDLEDMEKHLVETEKMQESRT